MENCKRRTVIVAVVACSLLVACGGAVAQETNHVSLVASGNASVVEIAVDLDIGGTLPPEWVGWVISRSTVGLCGDPVVEIGSQRDFPSGMQSYLSHDVSAVAGVTYMYRIYAVDDVGTRYPLPGIPDWSPVYDHIDFGSLNNAGAVAEGNLIDLGWTAGIEVCPTNCWTDVSFISDLPVELLPLVGTGAVVRLYGTMDTQFEGPYISAISGWDFLGECGPVATTHESWGDLKATYR